MRAACGAGMRALARITALAALLHLVGEGYYQLRWGQPFLALLADAIAVTLLAFAAFVALKPGSRGAPSLLAGAWGFESCLVLRAYTERLYAGGGAEPAVIAMLLGPIVLVTAAMFAWALLSPLRQADTEEPQS
jgi:hypothetical protein